MPGLEYGAFLILSIDGRLFEKIKIWAGQERVQIAQHPLIMKGWLAKIKAESEFFWF